MAMETTIEKILRSFWVTYPLGKDERADALDTLLQVWFAVLGDVPDAPLEAAALEYLKSPAQWRPVPGQLRARALELAGASVQDRAFEAWQKYADIDDGAMVREARKHSDAIALRAIAEMRANLRRPREEADVLEVMAERQRCFCSAYATLVTRRDALTLPAGSAVPALESENA